MFVPQGRHLLETMKQKFLPEVGWVKKEYINILLYYCIKRFQVSHRGGFGGGWWTDRPPICYFIL